jgi:hypothetical protein
MKVKITRPDGTVIEAEGTPEECGKLIGGTTPPITSPSLYPFWLQPIYPWYPSYPITYPVYPSYGDVLINPVITTPTWTTLGTTGVVLGDPPSEWATGTFSIVPASGLLTFTYSEPGSASY